jgi:multimeric flavodoxin WrbA
LKTLIINGSPRKNGDTAALISELRKNLHGDIVEISAYYDKITPCTDCRKCWTQKGCAVKDDMEKIYADDFDAVVIASPIYVSNLPGPVVSLASRFQAYYAAKRFLNDSFRIKEKKAALMLVGGGDGSPGKAIDSAKWIFKNLNAAGFEKNIALSLFTDDIPASEDKAAVKKVQEIALYFNSDNK